ncbi:sensor histidine kinase [Lacisediminihabitans changchengi]|uniref:Signal transduction histidine-protein kinase/phosphatase MprB n=1 Tax=Lacisediminihabitans changchengi TaxID=2787634 RepID=A0A934SJS9_9MICO|nr:HAMP domain-containing sensor histidine kinase [Lacisediminihabitans changchengi]MBK4346197.1 HAMP domain-containing histidine kinase [Lacisediminihabitans changchengi]
MRAWLGSLSGRITLVTAGVAVLAVLVTGLLSLQLVRSSNLSEARSQLATQAQLLSEHPATASRLGEQARLALGDTAVAVVSPDGTVTGDAAAYLRPAQLRALLAGRPVSVVERRAVTPVVVEGRPTAAGGAVVLARTEQNLEAPARATTGRIVIALVVGVVIALVAGALLGRWIARPLVVAAATARRMASGERDLPLPARGPSEITDVGHALAALDTSLSASEGRQREFLLSISHELRTPLTALRGYGEALADGVIPAAETATVGATLVAETERLDHFVADLLELARLEADDFALNPQPVDLHELLAQVRDAWGGRSANLGVALTVESAPLDSASLKPAPLVIVTDGRRLRQVVDGLVENALRVSPAGSTVTIAALRDDDEVRLSVSDGGPGLSPEDAAHAFERGLLQAKYRNERPVGTGLGLSIAARLVTRLGGTVVAGPAPGGGARFTVTLPV